MIVDDEKVVFLLCKPVHCANQEFAHVSVFFLLLNNHKNQKQQTASREMLWFDKQSVAETKFLKKITTPSLVRRLGAFLKKCLKQHFNTTQHKKQKTFDRSTVAIAIKVDVENDDESLD